MPTPDLDASVRILNSAATVVLDLTEAGGYDLVELGVPDRTWRRVVATSPFVDGEHLVAAVLEAGAHTMAVKVSGATWAQLQTRRQALVDAVEAWSWLLEVTISGVTYLWRASRSDTSSPLDKFPAMARQAVVTVKVPVQPTPTVS